MIATDNPVDVLHYLGQDPEEADRISRLNPFKMAAEMTKIANRLAQPKAQLSRAPAPIKPIGGSAKPSGDDIYDENMSDEQYWAAREKSGYAFAKSARH